MDSSDEVIVAGFFGCSFFCVLFTASLSSLLLKLALLTFKSGLHDFQSIVLPGATRDRVDLLAKCTLGVRLSLSLAVAVIVCLTG
jgi:hypothetical protein